VRPLVATAALVSSTPHAEEARSLLSFLAKESRQGRLASCLDAPAASAQGESAAIAASDYATRVVDWWLPQCSLDHNAYTDPQQTLGAPDAANLGGKDLYRGMISLGEGGYVVVEMAQTVVDGPGPDVRVYQTTSDEPVTLYASNSPSGPFVLIGLQVDCGVRTPGVFSNHCDFDLHDGGVGSARYFKIEDGEIYPCLAGTTVTEGADIDAIAGLNVQ
jgi:hypothetical protein